MPNYNFEGFDESSKNLDEALALGRPRRNVYLNRMDENEARLKAFDAADEAKDIAKRARHHEGKSTPFLAQSLGRGIEEAARSFVGFVAPFLEEEEMIEFMKEDQRIAEGYSAAMDLGGLGATHKFLADGVKNGTAMAGKMTVAAVTGGMPSLYVQYAAQGYTTAYYDARMAKKSKKDSAHHAGWMMGIEIGAMAVFHGGSKLFPKLLPDIESRIMSQLAGSVGAATGRRMASKAAAKIVNKSLLKSFGRSVGGTLWEGAVENVEEVATAVGHAARRAVDIPGAENEANWTDQNGNVMNSPMMKTILHTIRDTSGAVLFVNGAPKIRHGIRRFLNSPSRKHAKAAEAYLVAVGAAPSIESLKDEGVRIDAQQNVLKRLRDPEEAPDVIAIAEEYGVQLGVGVATHWEGADGELPPILQGRGAYEVIPGVALGPRGAETEQAERAIVQLHNELGAKYGYKLRIVDVKADGDLGGISGARITSNKTIWVTRQHIQTLLHKNKGNLKSVAAGIYAHELTHSLEESGGYEELMKFVHQNFRTDYLKARNAYKTAHELYRKEKGNEHVSQLSDEQLNKEGLAAWMESGFLKSGMLSKLAKSDMTLFERIRDWFYRRMNKWKDSREYGEVFKMIQKISREYGLPVKTFATKPVTDEDIRVGMEEEFDHQMKNRIDPESFNPSETELDSQLGDRVDREDFRESRKDPGQVDADLFQGEWEKSERDFEAGTTDRRIFEGGGDTRKPQEGLDGVTLEEDMGGDAGQSRPRILGREHPASSRRPAIQLDVAGRAEHPKVVMERNKDEYDEAMEGVEIGSAKEKALTRRYDEETDQLREDIERLAAYEQKEEYREAWDEAGERVREEKPAEESQAAHLERRMAEEAEGLGHRLDQSLDLAIEAHEVGTSTNAEIPLDISPPQALPDPSELKTAKEAEAARDDAWERVRNADRKSLDSKREMVEWEALRDRAELLDNQEDFASFTSAAQDFGLLLESEQTGEGVELSDGMFFDLPAIEDIYSGNISEEQEAELREFIAAVNEDNPGQYLLSVATRFVENKLDSGGRHVPVAAQPSVASRMQADLGVPISVAGPPTDEDTRRVAEDIRQSVEADEAAPAETMTSLESRERAAEPAAPPAAALMSEYEASTQSGIEGNLWLGEDGEVLAMTNIDRVSDNEIHLDFIGVGSEVRGEGRAGRVLKQITDLADKHGVTITLKATSKTSAKVPGLSTADLKKWYTRHGFKGKASNMVREPAAAPAETMTSLESRERAEATGTTRGIRVRYETPRQIGDYVIAPFIESLRGLKAGERADALPEGWTLYEGKKNKFKPSEADMEQLKAAFPDVDFADDFVIRYGNKSHAWVWPAGGALPKPLVKELQISRHHKGVRLRASIAHEMHHMSGVEGMDLDEDPTPAETVEYLTNEGEIAAHAVEAAVLFADARPGKDFDAAELAEAFPEGKWKNYAKFADQFKAEHIAAKSGFSAETIRAAGESFAAQAQEALNRPVAEAAAEPSVTTDVVEQAEEEVKRADDAVTVVSTDVGQEIKQETELEESEMLQATVPEGSNTVLESTAKDEDIGQELDFLQKVVAVFDAKSDAAKGRNREAKALREEIADLTAKGKGTTKEAEGLRDELAVVVEEALRAEKPEKGDEIAESENLYEMSVDEWDSRREEIREMAGRIADSDKLYTEMPDELKAVVAFVESHYGRLPHPVLEAQAKKLGRFLYRAIKADPGSLAEATVVAMMTPTIERDIHGNKVQDRNGKDKIAIIPSDLLDYVNNEQPREKDVRSVLQMTWSDVEASPARLADARVITSVTEDALTPIGREAGGLFAPHEPARRTRTPEYDDAGKQTGNFIVGMEEGDLVQFKGKDNVAVINSKTEVTEGGLSSWRYDIEFVEKNGREVPARKRQRRSISAYVPTVVTQKFTPARSEELTDIFKDALNSREVGGGKYDWTLDPELVREAFETIDTAGLSLEEKITNGIVMPELDNLGWGKQTKGGRSKLTELKAAARKDGLGEGEINSLIGKIIDHEIEEKSGVGYKKLVKLVADLDEARSGEDQELAEAGDDVQGAGDLSAAERISQRVEQTEGVPEKRRDIEGEIAQLLEQLEETQGSDEGEELVVMRGSEEERGILENLAMLQRQLDDNVQLALRGAGNEQTSLLVEIGKWAREVSEQFGFKNPTAPWMKTLVDYEGLREDLDKVMGDLARIYGDTGDASWEQESTELADRVYEDDKGAFDEIDGYIQIVEESGSVPAQAAASRLKDSIFANIFETTPERVIEDHDKASEQAASEDEDAYDPLEDEGRVSLDDIAGGILGEQLSLQADDLKNEITVLRNKTTALSRQIKEADHSAYSEKTRRALAKKMRSNLTLIGMLNKEVAEKLNKIYKIRREVSDRVQFETFGERPPARSTKVDDFQLALNLDRGKWEGMTKEEEEFYEGLVVKHYSSDDPKHWKQLEDEADLKWQRLVSELGPEGAREYIIKELEGITDGGGTPDHVLSILGNQLTEGIYAEAFGNTGNKEKQTGAAKMTRALLSYGTEVARKLYFLRRLNPIQKIKKALGEAFFLPPERIMTKVRKLKKQERHGDANKILDDWTDNKLPKLHKYLRDQGWNIENFDEIASDPMKASQLLDAISQFTARWDDKLFEYWRNSILSGPTTQIANLMGTVFYGAYELGIKRNMQAAANVFIKSDDLPTFEENLEVLKQVYVSATTSAVSNFGKAWSTEQMVLETQLREAGLAIGMDLEGKFGSGGKQYIKGKTGKFVRIPQRGLLAVDDYMKTVLTESYAMGYAFRASRKQVREGRLTIEDSPKFISHLMTADKKAERIWMPAYQQALRQAWQSELPIVGQMAIRLRNEYPITRFVIPFIVTPMNIMATGVAMSPFSGFMSLYRLATLKDQGVLGPAARVEQVEKIADGFTNTVLSGMWMMVLMALTDDDEPWITGSEVDVTRGRQRYGSGRIGEVPSQSIRFPFADKWFSYARVEPFATATALTIDLIKTMKHAGAGNTEKAMQDIGRGLYGQVTEKTFIRGISEVVQAMEETFKGRVAQGGGEYLSNFAVSFVPNIIRATARATQESMPERRMTTEKGKKLMSLLEITAKKTEILPALGILEDHPKTDFYGRKIPRHKSFGVGGLGDFLYRVVVPVPVKDTHSFVGDEVMKRYNNRLDDPMDAYIGPERPSRFFTVGGKKKYMSNAQYDEYNQMRGDLAREYTRYLSLNVDNPTEADIDKLKEGHSRASATAREYCVEKFWGDPTMIPLLEAKTANDLRADSIRAHSKVLSRRRPTLKSLSKEEKRLPYEMRVAILEGRVMEHEIVRESAAQFLISEGVSRGEAAASYGKGSGKTRGKKNIRRAMRIYGG